MSDRPVRLHRLKRLSLALGVVLLVALPRLSGLGGYLIVDESDRWRWAEEFYRALVSGDLRATLVGDGYPGILPVWLETIWLLGESLRRSILEGGWFGDEGIYMLFHVWSRTAYLPQQRLPIVLFNTLLALLVGWCTAKVYGRRVGLVALVLIALDPFYLADSRVNRAEAVITGLLTLSILSLIRYGQTQRYRWLITSGLTGGLSLLTKIQGMVVLPAVGAILVFFEVERIRGDRGTAAARRLLLSLGLSLLTWFLVAALTWLVLWPAMWIRPLDVFELVFEYATRKAGSEGVNLFFMGRHFFNEDPGALFYPVVALMRVTPLTMLGLVLAAWGAWHSLRSGSLSSLDPTRRAVISLLIYLVLYTGAMTFGSHKQDRYLMPIFPALDILAAMGWVSLWQQLEGRWRKLRAGHWAAYALVALVLVQAVGVLPYHPYYFPYFNPLLGGGQVGARTLRVGWGEGMDLVADYLNTKPDATDLRVAARWDEYMLGFRGQTLPFDQSGRWTQADYVVLYIQQTQRMIDPSLGVIHYFQARQPEHVVSIDGIEYAQIYPSPFTRPAEPLASVIPGRAALFGYRWEDSSSAPVEKGKIRVVWENQGVTQAPQLMVDLTDGDVDPAWYPCQTAQGFEAAARTPGEVVETVCDLDLAGAKLPAGAYDLRIGLTDGRGNVEPFLFPQGWRSVVKQADGTWRQAEWLESLDYIAQHQVPPTATPTDVYYQGQIRLVAYELSEVALQPGQPLTSTLYWQALVPVSEDFVVFNHLFGLDGTPIGQADELPVVPTSHWLPGQLITTTYRMLTDPVLPTPAVATLDIGLYNADRQALPAADRLGQPMSVTVTRVKFTPEAWPDGSPPIRDDALFGGSLLLVGHAPLPETISLEKTEPLTLQTWWQAQAPLSADYTVFVHLLDESGHVVAQADGVPVGGRYPTSAWGPGEQIVDTRQLSLPADLPAGSYRLVIGLYSPADGGRLQSAQGDADSVTLGQITVTR